MRHSIYQDLGLDFGGAWRQVGKLVVECGVCIVWCISYVRLLEVWDGVRWGAELVWFCDLRRSVERSLGAVKRE